MHTCNAYDIDRPTSPPLSVFLPITANKAAASTTEAPTNSNRNPNHLDKYT